MVVSWVPNKADQFKGLEFIGLDVCYSVQKLDKGHSFLEFFQFSNSHFFLDTKLVIISINPVICKSVFFSPSCLQNCKISEVIHQMNTLI